MNKQALDFHADDFDFGFSSVSEDEFKQRENEVAKQVHTQVTKDAEAKVQRVYKMIMPLLQNLKKDADKNEYIYWPNRAEKIDQFIAQLEKVVKND